MEIENQITELALAMRGQTLPAILDAVRKRFPDATEQQIVQGCSNAADILEAAADAYAAEAEAYRAEAERRKSP